MPSLIGQSLGRYQILDQVGEGGMATVYKAFDTHLECDVAVKVIRLDRLPPAMADKALQRFKREARLLAKLTHPNIVKIVDYGEFENQPYLVMVLLPGGNLKQKMTGQPMPPDQAARLLLPIARALEYAHGQGMIHRDIKPSNIMLTASGEPMLTDFGVAKLFDTENTAELTGTSMGVGTPEYMAPEQATSSSVDRRADVYALGVVLYELLTGRKPYQADTPLAVLFKHSTEPLPRPSQFVRGLSDTAEKVLLKALAKKPEDRYQDMGAFAGALEGLAAGGENSLAPSAKRPKQEKIRKEPVQTGQGAYPPSRSEKKRIPGWAVGLVSILGFLIVAGAALLLINKIDPALISIPGICTDRATMTSETIPDGTSISPGGSFIKTWTIKNVGTCTWTSDYYFVYQSGDEMYASNEVKIPYEVLPGNDVVMSNHMIAPQTMGTYRSDWLMRNPAGKTFGWGQQADQAFWVQISVAPAPTATPLYASELATALSWPILTSDSFDDNHNGWPTDYFSDSNGTISNTIQNGVYQVNLQMTPGRGGWFWNTPSQVPSLSIDRFYIAIDIFYESSSPTTIVGFIFMNHSDWIVAYFSNNRQFMLEAVAVGSETYLQESGTTNALVTGEANRIAVIGMDGYYYLFINDQFVTRGSSSLISQGDIGLVVNTMDSITTSITYDNFELRIP